MSTAANHQSATLWEIEYGITLAVQTSDPACANFQGVVISRCAGVAGGANWFVRGVKYGSATRANCDAALDVIVEKLQAEFRIVDDDG